MSQRASGYARRDHEHYPTPGWVVEALNEHVDLRHKMIWEPACGTGEMVVALKACGAHAHATDAINHGYRHQAREADFLQSGNVSGLLHYDGIVTNPPFGQGGRTAEAFIRSGLAKTSDYGFLALLLPVDFDSGKRRAEFFADCPTFAAKIVLTRRIVWFERPEGEPKAAPSANHAWFIWSKGILPGQRPSILYAPSRKEAA